MDLPLLFDTKIAFFAHIFILLEHGYWPNFSLLSLVLSSLLEVYLFSAVVRRSEISGGTITSLISSCFPLSWTNMSQYDSELRRERERLKLQVSALQAEIASLRHARFTDQVEYHQHIGALKDDISGMVFFLFNVTKYLTVSLSDLRASLSTAEEQNFILKERLDSTSRVAMTQPSVSDLGGIVVDYLQRFICYFAFFPTATSQVAIANSSP